MNTRLANAWNRLRHSWLFSTGLVVLATLTFRSAVADWHDVPTGSMQPTILIGDRITVNKLAYDLDVPFTKIRLATWNDPARGEVVTCWSPADGSRLVKRVIGLPGDTVEMKDGRLILDGQEVAYQPLPDRTLAEAMGPDGRKVVIWREDLPGRPHVVTRSIGAGNARDFGPVTVPEGKILVLGDNRDNSADSRYFGFVDRKDVCGRVNGIALSLDHGRHYLPRWERFLTRLI